MMKKWIISAVVFALALLAIGTPAFLYWRFTWVDFRTYDALARAAVAGQNPGVVAEGLECRRFEYEDNRVWRHPESTRVYHFTYYATNQISVSESPEGVTTTIPVYSISVNQDGSIRRASHGSHSYGPPSQSRTRNPEPPSGDLLDDILAPYIETNK